MWLYESKAGMLWLHRETPKAPTGPSAIQEPHKVGLLDTNKINIYFIWPRGPRRAARRSHISFEYLLK